MESPSILNPVSIINLNLSFKNISSLDEVKKYKNLIEIDLTGNSFHNGAETIKILFNFPFLKKLNLAYNNIFECWELPSHLETLILNNNRLTSINNNLLLLSSLITLDLSNNCIQDVSDLSRLAKLKFLFLKNNKISQVEALAELPSILELDLEGNLIEDREQIMRFTDHPTLKVLNLKNTSFFNSESYLTAQHFPSPLPNLPFVKEGALCKNPKSLKTSYIYSTLIDTSNPNRSALINKSLINSRKYSSDSEFFDEFEEEEDTPQDIPGSILGSVRSNFIESAGLPTSENSTRHDRKQSNVGEHHRQISNFDSKFSSTDKEPEKVSTANNSTRNPPDRDYTSKPSSKSVNTSIIQSNKPSMKLDLSSILKNKYAQPVHASLQLHQNGSYNNTATTSLFNSLNNSQIKISPILADPHGERPTPKGIPLDPRKVPRRLNLSIGDALSSGSNVTASFKTSAHFAGIPNLAPCENIGANTSSRNLVENYMNSLVEENQGLKKEVDIVRQTNHQLEKKLNDAQHETKSMQERKTQLETLKEENRQLTLKLKDLEKKNDTLKQDARIERKKSQDTHKGFLRVAKTHFDQSLDDRITSDQLLYMFDDRLRKLQESSRIDLNKRVLEQFDQLREYYRGKEERYGMQINDLESQIAFKYNDKLTGLQKLLKTYQKNLDLVMKKYNTLKQTLKEKKLRDDSQLQLQLPPKSQNDQSKVISRKLHTLLSDSSENIITNHNTSLNFTHLGEETQNIEVKDDHIHTLKHENVKLKQSLEGIRKKFENVIKENDDLKTVSNRNTYSLKVKIRDLEADNKRLMAILNKRELTQSPNSSMHHSVTGQEGSKMIHNKSVELKSRNSHLNRSLVVDRQTQVNKSTINKTSITFSGHKRENIKDHSVGKDASGAKVQNYMLAAKKATLESELQGSFKDTRKGVYTKKLSKILEANDKKGKKLQNYI